MRKDYTENKFIIFYDDDNNVYHKSVSAGISIVCPMPHYEEYDTEEEWKTRLSENFDITIDTIDIDT